MKTVARWQAPLKDVGFSLWLEYMEIVKTERHQESMDLAQKRLCEQLEASETRFADLPVAVAVKYDLDFDVAFRSPEATAHFDAQVQEEVSTALGERSLVVSPSCAGHDSMGAFVISVLLSEGGWF